MNPQTEALTRKIEQLQRDLISAKQKLGELETLTKQFEILKNTLTELSDQQAQFPETTTHFQKQLQEKQIFTWLSALRKQATQTQFLLNDFNEDMITLTAFLENNRTYRNYQFPTQSDLQSFLRETAFVYDQKKFSFKPNYMGVIDYKPLEQNGILERVGNDNWETTPENLDAIFSFLQEKKAPTTFKLETETIRILIKNIQTLKVEGPNPVIRRLDLVAKNKNGNPLMD